MTHDGKTAAWLCVLAGIALLLCGVSPTAMGNACGAVNVSSGETFACFRSNVTRYDALNCTHALEYPGDILPDCPFTDDLVGTCRRYQVYAVGFAASVAKFDASTSESDVRVTRSTQCEAPAN